MAQEQVRRIRDPHSFLIDPSIHIFIEHLSWTSPSALCCAERQWKNSLGSCSWKLQIITTHRMASADFLPSSALFEGVRSVIVRESCRKAAWVYFYLSTAIAVIHSVRCDAASALSALLWDVLWNVSGRFLLLLQTTELAVLREAAGRPERGPGSILCSRASFSLELDPFRDTNTSMSRWSYKGCFMRMESGAMEGG